ncbi:MAG: short chain dehydrogenase [Myxococcales bacterium]|nr:short chain dehydrogenase [Myxococcales bacterium]
MNKVALVTGGTRGIGRSITDGFLQAGYHVVAVARREPVGDLGGAQFFTADLREPEAVEGMMEQVLASLGRLDVLVNNAGGSPFALAAEASPNFHDKVIRLNLLAPLHCAQAANRIMQAQDEGGVIINIASVSGLRPSPGTAAYGAAKAGLISLSRSLAVEWAPKVRMNAIAAGLVRTKDSEAHYGGSEGLARVAATVPLGRMAEPHDVASLCVFLASEKAAYLSGSCLELHGGGEAPAFLAAARGED